MKKALSILLALVLLAASVCFAFAEEASFTINLYDQYGDTWNGAALNVEKIKDGAVADTTQFSITENGVYEKTIELDFDSSCAYMFSWSIGEYDSECSFTIEINGEIVCTVHNAGKLNNNLCFYLICEHMCTDSICSKCGLTCGEGFRHSFDEQTDMCIYCGFFCEHNFLSSVCTTCGFVTEDVIVGGFILGNCNQVWTIDENYTLTIAGTGEIEMLRTDAPWYSYINDIKNVVIEDGITAVSDQVFCNLSVCETISIPASVETFGAVYNNNTGAFVVDEDNKYLTAVDGVLFTADMKTLLIYPANSKNTSYTIPDSVETVGERAFDTASNLQTIIPGVNVKNVHSMCFTLTKITQFIPVSDIEFLDNYAFYYSDLVTAVVPDSATELGYYVFEGCQQLENLVLGKGLKTIGYDVLDNTPALSVVHFTGTEEEWDAMTKKVKTYRPEDKLVNIDVHYNCQLIEGTPATCTEEGVGDKWYCAECDKVIAGGNTLPVAGHNYNEDGICTDCGDEKVTVLAGDVSGDGKITAEDARLSLRASVGLETLSDEQAQAAEVTGDGIIKAEDARLILRASVGLETLN